MERIVQQCAVALFVRHPQAGRVKTRLARNLGNQAACDLYRAMVADALANVQASGLPLYLFHDGQDVLGLPQEWLQAAVAVIGQSGASLGERMTAAFADLFSRGCERVILIGSDIPGIDGKLLQSAVAAIEGADVVFAPAFDGGYCLVASPADRFDATIFRQIPWSSSAVLAATLQRCTSADLTYTLLEPRQDIDTLDDLNAYCRQPALYAVFTNRWLALHGYMDVVQ